MVAPADRLMTSGPSPRAWRSRFTISCSEIAPALSKSRLTRTFATGAMHRATPATKVPWPVYSGIGVTETPGGGSCWPVTPVSHG